MQNAVNSNNPGLSLGSLVEKVMQILSSHRVPVFTVTTCDFSSCLGLMCLGLLLIICLI